MGDLLRSDLHTTVLLHFFWDYPGQPVPEEIFFWTLWCKGRYQRQTHWQSGCAPLHLDYSATQFPHPPFLRRMPFLPQPFQFILAWDTHQISWLAYPMAWFWDLTYSAVNTKNWPVKQKVEVVENKQCKRACKTISAKYKKTTDNMFYHLNLPEVYFP